MNSHTKKKGRFWYAVAVLALLAGWLPAASLLISALRAYPSAIGEAYNSRQQKLEVPGTADLNLTREGAYGIYYEGHEGTYIHAEWPPRLDCRLTAKVSGDDVPLVPDYVPGNRYSTHDGRVGVLIYSTTVQEPGLYTLTCDDPLDARDTKHTLAIGPNYIFEFLRVAWHLGGRVLGALAIFFSSALLAGTIVVLTLIRSWRQRRVSEETAG